MRKWRCFPGLRITVGILILTGVAITGEAKHQLKFKFTTISVPSEPDTSIFGVSKAGVMVGTYVDSNAVYHGFIRSASGKVTTVDDPNGANTILEGISPKGKYIVGTYFSSDLSTRQGFLYQNATFVNLVPSGSTTSAAFGVNDRSHVVGEYVDSQGNGHGYYWDGTQYQTLDDPNGTNSAALGINNAGAITLYWFDSSGNVEGALYSGGQYTTINVPGAVDSVPWGIDSAGDIVFDWDWNTTGKSSHGALRTSRGVFYNFDDPAGPALTQPRGINDKKLLVGSYYNLPYSLQALHNFCSAQGCTDGANPRPFIQDAAATFMVRPTQAAPTPAATARPLTLAAVQCSRWTPLAMRPSCTAFALLRTARTEPTPRGPHPGRFRQFLWYDALRRCQREWNGVQAGQRWQRDRSVQLLLCFELHGRSQSLSGPHSGRCRQSLWSNTRRRR